MSDTVQLSGLQQARLLRPSLLSGICKNSCPLNWWCYPTTSSSVAPFSYCLQSFLASGSFPLSWLFASGGQSVGISASASILLGNIQGWFHLGLTACISLQSTGLSRVFSNTTVQKHQFFRVSLQRDKETFLHYWWECKLMQSLWRTVSRFLKKLRIKLPNDPAISLLGIYSEETITEKDTCIPTFIAAILTIVRTWKQPRWMDKEVGVHVYNEILLNIKRNKFKSMLWGGWT